MSDRTMIDVAGKAFSVPRLLKRAIQVLTALGLTALVTLVIIAANSMLTAKGGTIAGFNTWLSFIQQPEVIGTMVLTAVVTVFYLQWEKPSSGGVRR
ncbi:MAG: hypothetical protein NW216_14155 [Hyphomicrobium sp.]|nr:hypothetical protein [Hyphomicrobium sp.]